FDRFLRSGRDVQCLGGHDEKDYLGRLRNGSLVLRADSRGLWYECTGQGDYIDHHWGMLIRTGRVAGSSMYVMATGYTWRGGVMDVHEVGEIRDVGPA